MAGRRCCSCIRICCCLIVGMVILLPSGGLSAKPYAVNIYYQSLSLVKPAPLLLPYRNGPVLSGADALDVYVIWYGAFTVSQKAIVEDFLNSFSATSSSNDSAHAVSAWWATTSGYVDKFGQSVTPGVRLASQVSDETYSLGKKLTPVDIENLILRSIHGGDFTSSSKALYTVLTADDVYVAGFCLNSCGFHAYTFPTEATSDKMLPYACIGNSATQCPGQCAWPFAVADFGPQTPPLVAPNGDVGMDGMIINLATVIAGAATNPFGTGYYQGDATDPLEAVSACTGIFGRGAYPGYPGEILTHSASGASFNAYGTNGRRFLIPAMWNPLSLNCIPL
ncbi:hypothetical protein KP509_08G020000 [Ceratopteris richardii]|uniref:Uncharacterized protein n=1 Tax=Ceratopteris richardii TaxID=49495 RepID=A0A8T2U6E7_CERRI|nr:hypothetical protein KP509_08G020000 [Ceratopteris richardii]